MPSLSRRGRRVVVVVSDDCGEAIDAKLGRWRCRRAAQLRPARPGRWPRRSWMATTSTARSRGHRPSRPAAHSLTRPLFDRPRRSNHHRAAADRAAAAAADVEWRHDFVSVPRRATDLLVSRSSVSNTKIVAPRWTETVWV